MTENQQDPQQTGEYYDDEISLIELWLTLMRRKWIILGVTALCLALGIGYASLQEPVYRYTSTIEMAHFGDGEPIESTDSVKILINKTFTPIVREEMSQEYQKPYSELPKVETQTFEGSDRLLQSISEGTKNKENEITTLHKNLIKKLETEYSKLIDQKINSLRLKQKNIIAEQKRLDEKKDRLKKRIETARDRLSTARELQRIAPKSAGEESRAMTLLLIQSQIEKDTQHLEKMEEQLHTQIPDEKEQLNQRLEQIDHQLENINFVEARTIALQSENPAGIGLRMVVALSLIIGVMLGVFGAFFVEFLSKAQAAAKEQ